MNRTEKTERVIQAAIAHYNDFARFNKSLSEMTEAEQAMIVNMLVEFHKQALTAYDTATEQPISRHQENGHTPESEMQELSKDSRELLIAYHKFLDWQEFDDEGEISNNVDLFLQSFKQPESKPEQQGESKVRTIADDFPSLCKSLNGIDLTEPTPAPAMPEGKTIEFFKEECFKINENIYWETDGTGNVEHIAKIMQLYASQEVTAATAPLTEEITRLKREVEELRYQIIELIPEIPYYAYGDNEAACEMASGFNKIRELISKPLPSNPNTETINEKV